MTPSIAVFGLLLIGVCAASPLVAAAASITVHVADDTGAPVANAVVYATPVGAPPVASKQIVSMPKGAIIDQVNKQFVPLVTVLQTGAAVTFPNRDNIRHEVYSFSAPKIFKLKLYSGTPAEPVVFDKPDLVVLGCNIHDRMLAFVYVVDAPYFAKTAADGSVRIDGLPAGDYRLRLWHPRLDAESPPRALTLAAADNAEQGYALVLGPPPMTLPMTDM